MIHSSISHKSYTIDKSVTHTAYPLAAGHSLNLATCPKPFTEAMDLSLRRLERHTYKQ